MIRVPRDSYNFTPVFGIIPHLEHPTILVEDPVHVFVGVDPPLREDHVEIAFLPPLHEDEGTGNELFFF